MDETRRVIRMATVEECSESFFKGTVSKALLCEWVKQNAIPHVRIGSKGKILFDLDVLTEWWDKKLAESTKKRGAIR